MNQRYVIKGTIRMGELVRLLLMKEDVARPVEKMGMLEMATKAQEIIESQQTKAILTQSPDTITISYDEWKKYEYKVDDIIWVDVKAEK